MNRIKILGIGSPFGDDQAGWKVIENLQKHLIHSPHIVLESEDRPGVRLIELMHGFHTVFIIDAVKSGNEVGTIHRFKNDVILDCQNRFSTHGLSILEAIQLASTLHELPDTLIFYGIEVDTIILDSTLSQRVEEAIKKLVKRLKKEIT